MTTEQQGVFIWRILLYGRIYAWSIMVATHPENLEMSGTLRVASENVFLHVVTYGKYCS